MDHARNVMERIEALARISEEPNRLTRTFCSTAMRKALGLVAEWMRDAGMSVRIDAIGNIIGRYGSCASSTKTFVLGSHLDTVADAGKFDGPLGVILAIECVRRLAAHRQRLPFAIEVVGFADEEGVRYQSTYLGSKVIAGTFDTAALHRLDADGIPMSEAIRNFGGNPDQLASAAMKSSDVLGYMEAHIEQGPVLEQRGAAVGVVSAIAGQTRADARFVGEAGHAGTVPMPLRHDALCAAAQFILAVESFASRREGLVATVGKITASPGASNVIPGSVSLTLDLRHADDSIRDASFKALVAEAQESAKARQVQVTVDVTHQAPSVACDPPLSEFLKHAVRRHQPGPVPVLPSGAGHDAAVIASITPVAMLFVRCKGGLSHNPAEEVSLHDIGTAFEVMTDFLNRVAAAGDEKDPSQSTVASERKP